MYVSKRGGLSYGTGRWVRRHLRTPSRVRGLADPSKTGGISRQYRADLRRRWQRISSLIWETVAVNDALRLGNRSTVGGPLPVAAAGAATPFQFRTKPDEMVDDFILWLNDSLDDEVLEITRGPRGRIQRNTRWQSTYVRASYSKGLEHADRSLRQAGIRLPLESIAQVFAAPVATESLARLYARSFNDLDGITRATSQQIGRVLTDGLATGQGPRKVAREMRSRVSSIGLVRSVTMARTEIINAHAEATLNRYQQAGVQGVSALAEFLTAQDDRVCPQCEALEATVYKLEEARGLIPVHANCRCVWLPKL
jgi:SPP1 gp7 family putative phage head morphogenesis protein